METKSHDPDTSHEGESSGWTSKTDYIRIYTPLIATRIAKDGGSWSKAAAATEDEALEKSSSLRTNWKGPLNSPQPVHFSQHFACV